MDIIATISSSLIDKVSQFVEKGASILRINGAHTPPSAVSRLVAEIRKRVDVRILLDLPTSKIRTQNLDEVIALNAGETFVLHKDQLNIPALYKSVVIGDRVFVNEGQNILTVSVINANEIVFQSDSDGYLGNNRGLVFERKIHTPDFPFFFQKDLELIKVANELNIEFVGVSYLRYPSDKALARKLIANPDSILYKIETYEAMQNYKSLISSGEHILIDRGDLASDIGILNTPKIQAEVIRFSQENHIKVFVATQFLLSMLHNCVPSISDIYCLFYTIKSNVDGIQLSEETVIGKHPLQSIECVMHIIRQLRG